MQKKPLQHFEFSIQLQVSGEELQEHDVKSILKILTKADLYKQHPWMPKFIGSRSKKQTQCSICFDTVKKNQICYITSCNHYFHKTCMQKWFNTQSKSTFQLTCPYCRQQQRVDFAHENVYKVETKWNVVDNKAELERTIRRDGSNYVRYHDVT